MLSVSRSVLSYSLQPHRLACQAPLSIDPPFKNAGVGSHSLGDLLNPGIKPGSPTLQANSLPFEPPGKLDANRSSEQEAEQREGPPYPQGGTGEGRLPSLLHAPRDCGLLLISLNSYNLQEKVVPRGKGDKVGGDCPLRPLFGFTTSVFWLRLQYTGISGLKLLEK